MNIATILVLVVIAAAVVGAVVWRIRLRKRCESGCGCCALRSVCGKRTEN